VLANLSPLSAWLLPTAVGAPWVAAIVWLWRRRPRDGFIPASMADHARQRFSSR
jgi:hypothetical protein